MFSISYSKEKSQRGIQSSNDLIDFINTESGRFYENVYR
jgi:hypothetical protein